MQDIALCCGRLPPCSGLIWLCVFILPGTPVGLLWFNSHYQCPTYVSLPLTVLVAHWPQRGTKRAKPMLSHNESWTTAWHLQLSFEYISFSSPENNTKDNGFILSWILGGMIWQLSSMHKLQSTAWENWNMHVTFIRTHTERNDQIPRMTAFGIIDKA